MASIRGAGVATALAWVASCSTAERDFEPYEAASWVPPAAAMTPARIDWTPPETKDDTPNSDAPVTDASVFTLPPQAGAYPIGLEQVLRVAGSEALLLRMAQEDAKSAEAEEQLVLDSLLPTLSLRGTFNWADGKVQNTAGDFFDVEERQNAFFGPAAELSFDPAVAIFRADEAAERTDAFVHGIRATTNDVLRDAAFLYFDLIEAYALVEIAKRSLGNYADLVDYEESRVGSGATLESNLLRAQARLARSEQERVFAENGASVASTALVELLRMDPHIVLAPAVDVLETIELVEDAPLEVLVADGLERRPEMYQARALHRAAQVGEDFWQKRWMIPRLDLLAQYGGFGEDFGDLDDNQLYQAGLTWDFQMTDRSERARARAAQRRAGFTEEAVIRAVSREVVNAHEGVAAAREAIAATTDEVSKTQKIFDLLRVRYESGAANQLELLVAEIELTRSQVSFVRSLTTYNKAQYDLFRATGGGEQAPSAGDED